MKTYDLGEVHHVSNVFEHALGDNESPRQLFLSLLLNDSLHYSLQVFHIIMLIPSDRTSRDLYPFAD